MPSLAHFPILFAIAAAASWLALPEPAEPCRVQDPDPDAAATCGMCHKDFYQEWKGRAHANSWTDPIHQAAIAKVKSPEACHNCHIPQQVLKKLGRKPEVRTDRRDEGVTCVACHKSGDKIHGPFGAQTDAHPGEKDPAFQSGSTHLCASCHSTKIGPVLPVARDFLEAKMEEKGKSCVGCHMPEIERHLAISPATGKPTGEKRKTRDHRVLGPGDPDYCAKAFALAAVKDGKDAVLSVRNEAGHRVPGLMLREFVFRVRQLDAAGKDLASGSVTLSHENELRAAETREFRFALAAGAATLAVEVDHVFQGKVVATVRKETLPL
jgi:nitrate/TMAO reductase-like tetraheme cytochrome c subunit